jgi:hypothetical protein
VANAGTAKFSGSVLHGEDFDRRLSNGLWFCLLHDPDANGGGWLIAIQESCEPGGHNFATIATPPFHGVNDTEIDAWHFDPGANAPQSERDFSFVLSDEDWQRLMQDLNSYSDPEKMLKELVTLGSGHGKLTITAMKRHQAPGGASLFDSLAFDVTLKWPSREK